MKFADIKKFWETRLCNVTSLVSASTSSPVTRDAPGVTSQSILNDKKKNAHDATQSMEEEVTFVESQSKLEKPVVDCLPQLRHNELEKNVCQDMKRHNGRGGVRGSPSAPASLNCSPLRGGARGSPSSNTKFIDIHNFWKVREKKLVRQSVEKRRCFGCGCFLNNRYYEHGDALYCEDDYWKKFGHKCKDCDVIITGPIMIAGVYRFHPECFKCRVCMSFISDGDLYGLVCSPNKFHIFCHVCYKHLGETPNITMATMDVILVVNFLPLMSDNRISIGVSPDKIPTASGFGISVKDIFALNEDNGQVVCGVEGDSPLQINDKLLQINGLRVDHNALNLIERLSDRGIPLQMTVQRKVNLPIGESPQSRVIVRQPLLPQQPEAPMSTCPPTQPTTQPPTNYCCRTQTFHTGSNMKGIDVGEFLDPPTFDENQNDETMFRSRSSSSSSGSSSGTLVDFPSHSSFSHSSSSDEDLPQTPLASRSMRGGFKRKPSSSTPESLDIEPPSPMLSPTLPQSPTTMLPPRPPPTRRSNSLRNGTSVIMRKESPRNKASEDDITYKQYPRCLTSDLNRSESMRVATPSSAQRVFRPCDLILGEVLGQGFFGRAIKVTHRDSGEVMVLKVLNSLDEDVEKSFLKEVKVLRNLNHPNVLRFIGVLYQNKRLNIITEFVECGTLKDVISNMDEPLPWQHRTRIARDIASGMAYLHSMQVIHRDLNSGNCFMKEDGTAVVADFGLARVLPKSTSLGRRKRYTVVGTPYWMAPEMVFSTYYDERVDVFSYSIVLCEVIGRVEADPDFLPRNHDFGLAVVSFHSKFCTECPPFLFALAARSSSLNPDERPSFQTLETWLEMLTIREDLPHLPEPPNLRSLVQSVYNKYELHLPDNLYEPIVTDMFD
uniref:LIM domain kinase 1-like n=1 Tax=Ciona intestinalis TaxID=7719 RepID=UPI0002B8EDEB|nr:LIM domain kinase 1-like [Ciona intestinalis]|eukprot:XP_002130358.4 LIM domain kinase 1-like [Ciona intestinalis]